MDDTPLSDDGVDASRNDESMDAALASAFSGQHTTALHLIQHQNGFVSQLSLPPDAAEAASTALVVGERVRASARYESIDRIAEGGLGEIFRGQDCDLGREVALKVLRAPYRDHPWIVRRFVEEAQIGGQLQHPGILPIYEIGLGADQRPFIAMKLVRGQTLAKLLRDRADPSQDRQRFLRIFEQICQALAYVHARGVVHRDVKPTNIMVGAFGEVQVMDFGFAKVLRQAGIPLEELEVATVRSSSAEQQSVMGSVFGTPAYMPPEQAEGRVDELDERADVFALGAILHEILTGAPLYAGENLLEQAKRADLAPALARLGATGDEPELVQIARDCIARARDARPRSAREVAERMTRFLTGVEERARAAAVAAEGARVQMAGMRRARRLQLALAVAVLSIIGLGGVGYWWIDRDRASRRAATGLQLQAAVRDVEDTVGKAQQESDTATAAGYWREVQSSAARITAELAASDLDANVDQDLVARVGKAEASRRQAEADAIRTAQDAELKRMFEVLTLPTDQYNATIVGSSWDAPEKDRAYEAAFTAYGTHPLRDQDAFVERVKDFAVRAAVALDDWTRHRRSIAMAKGAPADATAQTLLALARRLDPDKARNRLREVFGRTPLDADELVRLGDTLDLAQEQPETIVELGLALYETGHMAEAVSVAKRGAPEHPRNFLLCYMASLAHMTVLPVSWQDVRRTMEAAIALRGDYAYARYNAAMACAKLGLDAEADAHYRRAMQIQRPAANFDLDWAATHLENHLEDRALEELTALTERDVGAFMHPVGLALAWFCRGRVLELRCDLDGALSSYRRAEAVLLSRACRDKPMPNGWSAPAATRFANNVETWLREDPALMRIVNGAKATSEVEQVDAALAALRAGRSVRGATMFRDAAEANVAALDVVSNHAAIIGAELAVSAGTGRDAESEALTEDERRAWRLQGYRWLRRATDVLLRRADAWRRENVRITSDWVCVARLWVVRFEAPRSKLPPDEARAWHALWADIEAIQRGER